MEELKVEEVGRAERLSLYVKGFYSRYSAKAILDNAFKGIFTSANRNEFVPIITYIFFPLLMTAWIILVSLHVDVFLDTFQHKTIGWILVFLTVMPFIILARFIYVEINITSPTRKLRAFLDLIIMPYNFLFAGGAGNETGPKVLGLLLIFALSWVMVHVTDYFMITLIEEYLFIDPSIEMTRIDQGSSDILKYEADIINRHYLREVFLSVVVLHCTAIAIKGTYILFRNMIWAFRRTLNAVGGDS